MPIGRPKNPGTDAERAEARRAKVRVNVQAFRQRQKEKKLAAGTSVKVSQDRAVLYHSDSWSDTASSRPTTSPSPDFQEQESDYADPDSWIWQLSRDLGTDFSYQDAFLAALQYHCLPNSHNQQRVVYEPCKGFSICNSNWIQAGALEVGTPALKIMNDAVLASALTVVGGSRNDIDMVMRGSLVQSRALRGLRFTLQRLASGEDNACISTLPIQALTCAVSELLANRDWDNFASHLIGVGALIEHSGPESLRTRDLREHFYGYRSMQAAFSIMYGHALFLADPQWIEPSWKHEVTLAEHPLHTMLDIAFKLLPEMKINQSQSFSRLSDLSQRLQRLRNLSWQFDEWERNVSLNHEGRLYSHTDATWTGLYDYAFSFSTLSVGIAFAMYAGMRIKLAWTTKETMEEILAQDPGAPFDPGEAVWSGLKWVRRALQSLEYFHTGRPKICGKIATLLPLELSWNFVSDVHAEGRIDTFHERQWCLATAHRLSSMDINVFRWR